MKEPLRTFIAYAREDRALKEQLELHLLRLQKAGELLIWSDRELVAGESWNDRIHDQLEASRLFLLLISPHFLASDYCFNTEMRRALQRQAEDQAVVVPVILSDCAWRETALADVQVLPDEGRPVASPPGANPEGHPSVALDRVVDGVARAIEAFRRKNRPTIRWQRSLGSFEWKNELLLAGDRLVASTRGDAATGQAPGLVALDPSSGEPVWRLDFAHGANGVAWFDGRLFAGDVGGNLHCVRPSDGRLLWRRELGEPLFARPVKVTDDPVHGVLVLGLDGGLWLLDVADGRTLAQLRLDGRFRANPVVDGYDVYVGSEQGELHAIMVLGASRHEPQLRRVPIDHPDEHANSGWSRAGIYGDVVLHGDELLLPFTRQTYYAHPAIVALDRRTLALRQFAQDAQGAVGSFGSIRSTPIVHRGELIWAEPYSSRLVALDMRAQLSWALPLGQQMFPQWASPALDPRTHALYVARESGWLYKANAVSHRRQWGMYLGEADLAGETVRAEQDDGAARQATPWESRISRPLRMTPLFDAASDRLYAGTTDGRLYAIENL